MQKRILVFTSLENEIILLADGISAAHLRRFRARKHGRISAGCHKHMRKHRGAGGFAVHTRNADAMAVELHDICKQIRAINDRHTFCRGCRHFGILHRNGTRIHDGVIAVNIISLVDMNDGDTVIFQALRHCGIRSV